MLYQDIYDSGFKERNKGHFASIVRVAFNDGAYTQTERDFIDALANKLDISEEDYKAILKNPNGYPVNPPYLQEQRIERLYDLARMVFINYILGPEQKATLRKFTSALGFAGNIPAITDKALSLLVMEYNLEDFKREMDVYIKEQNKKAS
ncbi:TerB family tellurite resistance protein [Myroides sp. JBRI-B21084]|nr:TerB family tellurite resistance protein [Paenimyroides cloacae]WKW47646.1 TerB family tellurite resistance protein [Paenimyroides cloacae]